MWAKKGDQWTCVATLSSYHDRSIYDVKWSDNNYIATASGDDSICIFRPNTLENSLELVTKIPEAHETDVNSVDWNSGDQLCSCGDDGRVKIWNFNKE